MFAPKSLTAFEVVFQTASRLVRRRKISIPVEGPDWADSPCPHVKSYTSENPRSRPIPNWQVDSKSLQTLGFFFGLDRSYRDLCTGHEKRNPKARSARRHRAERHAPISSRTAQSPGTICKACTGSPTFTP